MKSELQKVLESQGYKCLPYYYPEMGKNILATHIDYLSELWYLGFAFGRHCGGSYCSEIENMMYKSDEGKFLIFFPLVEYIESYDLKKITLGLDL